MQESRRNTLGSSSCFPAFPIVLDALRQWCGDRQVASAEEEARRFLGEQRQRLNGYRRTLNCSCDAQVNDAVGEIVRRLHEQSNRRGPGRGNTQAYERRGGVDAKPAGVGGDIQVEPALKRDGALDKQLG